MTLRSAAMTLACVSAILTTIGVLSSAAGRAQAGSAAGRVSVAKGPSVSIGPTRPYGGGYRPQRCGKSGICPGPTPRQGTAKPASCQASGAGCTKQY
jgi:hypothetical protein